MSVPVPHLFDPADDTPEACLTCGLPAKNVRHASPATLPAVTAPRVPVGMEHPRTSVEAAAAAIPRAGSLRAEIIRLILAAPSQGLTDDELEVLTGRTHQSVSASRNGLVADGWLEPEHDENGKAVMRLTRSLNAATSWAPTAAALRQRRAT